MMLWNKIKIIPQKVHFTPHRSIYVTKCVESSAVSNTSADIPLYPKKSFQLRIYFHDYSAAEIK